MSYQQEHLYYSCQDYGVFFQDEFLDAYNYCKELYKIGIDGLIIQDLGLAYYLHQRIKDLPLHASTQLSCKSVSEAESLLKLGLGFMVCIMFIMP